MVFLLGAGSDLGLFDLPKFKQFHGFPFNQHVPFSPNLYTTALTVLRNDHHDLRV
jgi:hypothetical protein